MRSYCKMFLLKINEKFSVARNKAYVYEDKV